MVHAGFIFCFQEHFPLSRITQTGVPLHAYHRTVQFSSLCACVCVAQFLEKEALSITSAPTYSSTTSIVSLFFMYMPTVCRLSLITIKCVLYIVCYETEGLGTTAI